MLWSRSKVARLPVASTRRSTAFVSSFTIWGTASSIVTRCSRNVRARTGGWRLVGYTTDDPAMIGASRPGFSPYMCDSGRIESSRVSGPIGTTLRSDEAFVAMLRCVSITPFGSPVVPDVNTISARESGSTSGRGSFGPVLAWSTSDSTVRTGSSMRLAAFSVGVEASTSRAPVWAATFIASSSVVR